MKTSLSELTRPLRILRVSFLTRQPVHGCYGLAIAEAVVRGEDMRRREFITLSGGTAVAWPLGTHAQATPIRIGFLASGAAGSSNSAVQIDAIKRGLRENGLMEGRDYILEAHFAAGDYGQFPEMARKLAQAGARVILVNTIASVRAAQNLTPPVPVVMLAVTDPVGTDLVATLARPGGHTTGMATLTEDLTPKLLEFQREVIPKATTIAALFNPANPANLAFLGNLRGVTGAMGMTVLPVELKSPDELEPVFSTLAAQRPDTLQLVADSGNLDLSDRIAALALAHRLPSFSTVTSYAEFGGLMAYGISLRALFIRAASFVERILDGAKPGDLPVEQPTKIELVINLKAAKTLGLSIPPTLLSRADQVIE
jgi:putative ABC transport system substrate-binding protein